ncbi:MAG: diaminopimelate decarboxylase [Chloroflexi bacterium]|nr:diaminopimelate decarboxylase [Chloroflexota bacterium]
MENLAYVGGYLRCEGVDLRQIAELAGTPTYLYSQQSIVKRFEAMDRAFAGLPHLVCFALKANSNLAIGRVLAERGAGADIVSGGELYRALKMGIRPDRIIFAGVGKTAREIAEALEAGILLFNVESEGELLALDELAGRLGLGKRAPIALRVNPDVDPQTHPYIATGMKKYKFGIAGEQIPRLYRLAQELPNVEPLGIQMHIGSQLVRIQPIVEAVTKIVRLVEALRADGLALRYIDIGGGLGIAYRDETPEGPARLAAAIGPLIQPTGCTLLLEPGRFIVGNGGGLLTRVLYVKDNGVKKFVIVDAGMNDLIRPSLYDAYHEIRPVRETEARETVDVVGPICESGDFFAHDRPVAAVNPGDLLLIASAGAYGFAMASNYNARPRPAEVLIAGDSVRIVRRRETYEDLIRGEELS